MKKIYITDIKPLCSDSVFEGLYLKTNEYFKLKIDRKNRREDKNRTLAGAYLLEKCLAEYGVDAERTRISEGEKGKPQIDTFPFNISHSGEYAVIAVGDGEIGVDIEKIKSAPTGLLDRIALPNEKAKISAAKEILRLWTRKEAFAKCLGTGIGEEIWTVDLTGDAFVFKGKAYNLRTFVFDDYYISGFCEEDYPPNEIVKVKLK